MMKCVLFISLIIPIGFLSKLQIIHPSQLKSWYPIQLIHLFLPYSSHKTPRKWFLYQESPCSNYSRNPWTLPVQFCMTSKPHEWIKYMVHQGASKLWSIVLGHQEWLPPRLELKSFGRLARSTLYGNQMI